MTPEVLPVVQGDWVATKAHDNSIQIGRVRQSWRDPDGTVLMNVVLYDPAGANLGRVSTPEGGPTTFEPAIEFDDNWQRIDKPRFPLEFNIIGIRHPTKPDWVTLSRTLYHEGEGTLKPKPVRTRRRKQSSDYAHQRTRVIVVEADPKNLQEDIESSSLRRAAQELRDAARHCPAHVGTMLRQKAQGLEKEADQIKARFT